MSESIFIKALSMLGLIQLLQSLGYRFLWKECVKRWNKESAALKSQLSDLTKQRDELAEKCKGLPFNADKYVELVGTMESNNWDLRCVDNPTGGGDYETWWVIIEHYMAKPKEREIGRGETPLKAFEDAMLKLKS